jgi:hypothetical protein
MKDKKSDRKINALVRRMNKSIEKDELWRGCFVVRQVKKRCGKYEDNSGIWSSYLYIIIDKKTAQYGYSEWLESYSDFNAAHLWWGVNNFIVDGVKVWNEEPRPTIDNAVDYTKMPIPKNLTLIKPYGFFGM